MFSSIPEPLSVWLHVTVIVFVVDVPVGASLFGAVSSFHIANNVTVALSSVVKFLTLSPG